MKEKTVAIIHFNTPELTESAIKSIRKHGGGKYRVIVFDNSDTRPFTKRMRGVDVIDNTKGQIIDFEAKLAKFPEKDRTIGCAKGCEFGSAKHMMTVQKLWELLPEGFVLMESDILLKRDIDEFFADGYSVYGYWQKSQPNNPFHIGRMLPMLCWMNVPMLKARGAKYFDPERTYGLLPGGRSNRNNWYDTGAVLLEDILRNRPHLKGYHRDIREFVEHYGSGSWANNDLCQQTAWLEKHHDLWQTDEKTTVAICAIGRLENRYAVEWVEHYNSIGVDKIFIYDNNREEDGEQFADVLHPYIEEGLVEITHWTGNQKQAYEECYNRHNNKYDWMGFFDFDEFLRFHELTKFRVHDFLKMFYSDVVVINWRLMTDNGQTHYDPRPLSERFTEAAPKDIAINHHVKSFVRGGIDGISFNDPHCPNAPELTVANTNGVQVPQKPIQDDVIHTMAWIDHYDTKSTEEWVAKVKRGWCDAPADIIKQRQEKSVELYFSINRRTPEKEEILGVKPANRESKPKTKKSTYRKGK